MRIATSALQSEIILSVSCVSSSPQMDGDNGEIAGSAVVVGTGAAVVVVVVD